MPRKIKDVTKDYLVNVALPVHGQSYTVISHQSIVDYAYAELANQGFGIVNEEYRATLDGQIAQGIYRLQYGTDPEMNVMFAWTNSYNKQIKFKCATGGYINANQTVMLAGELGTYARKHTGTADADVIASMQAQITDATMYYNQLVSDKEVMKTIQLTSRRQAELLGILFAEYDILTTEQASIIRQQMDKPTFFYNGGKDTLWAFYNHVTVSLQQSHPRSWMEDQRMLHWVISNEFNLNQAALAVTTPVEVTTALVDPLASNYGEPENQTNLLVQIAEVTGDDSVLDVQYPVTEDKAFVSDDVVIHIESDQEYLERIAKIEGEPKMTELLDNQVVQNGSDFDIDVHRSDEMILDTHDLVQYTDPAGNTFELPMLKESEIAVDLAEGESVSVEKEFKIVDLDFEDDNDWDKLEAAGVITPSVVNDLEIEKEEPTIDLSNLEGEYAVEEMPAVLEVIEEVHEPLVVEASIDNFDISFDLGAEPDDNDMFF